MFEKLKKNILIIGISVFLIGVFVFYLILLSYKNQNLEKIEYGVNDIVVYPKGYNHMVLIGDSRAKDWHNSFSENINYINLGVNGQTSIETLQSFKYNVDHGFKPQSVILQVGINDLKCIGFERDIDITKVCINNISEIIRICTSNDIEIIYTSIFPVGKPEFVRKCFLWDDITRYRILEVNCEMKKIVAEIDNAYYFDSYLLLKDMNDQHQICQDYSRDFLHLNTEGYKLLSVSFENFYLSKY
ncbi:SGNH/GDSL hydrolase family protein [Labilibacter marinus]|uniref:SGNH/GDSL hydrolase family protein n=1 Tax=Labilibacter marinus TaxID=1477105 RepID=UPI00082B7E2A|nr:GDSL-type esterase/lipase family protein [Labilibacter marinus]